MSYDPTREQSLERSLPHSAEAERACLGGVVIDNGLISQAIELLRPEDFYIPSHRKIYTAMIALFERGGEINPILIGEELKKENALESVGGISFITNLTYGLPHSTNIAHYAKVVRGKAYLRNLIRAGNKIVSEALEGEDEPEVIGDDAEKLIFDLRDTSERGGGKFEAAAPIAERILERIQEQEGHSAVLTGLTTGFIDVDRITSGLAKQNLIIVAGRPAMGKSSYAAMLALNVAQSSPLIAKPVVAFFTLETSKDELVMRFICQLANVDFQRFRQGFLSRPEWAQIAKALGVLSDTKIFVDDTAGITSMELRAKTMRLVSEQKQLDLIVVDYLGKMKGTKKKYDSKQQEISDISNDLANLAKELNVPLVALSQLSRAPEARTDHRPQLSDLRDSGSIEQDAHIVKLLYRPDYYKTGRDKDSLPEDERNVIEVIIAKNKNGPTDVVRLRWTPSSMRMDNLTRE